MIKFIFILASIFIVGFFIVHDTWMVTITAFDFEVRTSILTVIVAYLLMLYLWHLIKKPFQWITGCKNWWEKRKQTKKEAYLFLALKTVLDHDTNAIKQLLKQKNTFFDKKSDENYIIEALFDPSTHIFEHLMHRENTELAGIKGLLEYAKNTGDISEASRLLQKAADKHPNEPWIQEALWNIQVSQNDWNESLNTLDILKKKGCIDKDKYTRQKALVFLKLGRVKEAYQLMPDQPETAIAYAESEPKKAQDIISDLWKKEPCWSAFPIFQRTISAEAPAKQMKAVEKLVKYNPSHKLSLLALAQTALSLEMWGVAKEYLTTYINMYPLTVSVHPAREFFPDVHNRKPRIL